MVDLVMQNVHISLAKIRSHWGAGIATGVSDKDS